MKRLPSYLLHIVACCFFVSGCAVAPVSPHTTEAKISLADQMNLGIESYHEGRYELAVDLLLDPAMSNMVEAQYYLGLLFDQSATADHDYDQARLWYEEAAKQGHSAAMNNLGVIYDKGLGVEKDRDVAAQYFRDAAMRGYARGQTNLGVMYVNGRGVEKDLDTAIYWFTLAATNGESDAMINLGYIAESGMHDDVNYEDALHWYSKASELDDSNGHFRLGSLYRSGNGVEKDQFKATSLFYRSGSAGHLDSQLQLWERYRDGIGVQKDLTEALSWLQRAAENGDNNAQLTLGKNYLFGLHSPVSTELGVFWIYTAAEAGSMEAQAYLGYIFEKGIGIAANTKQAYSLYRHVAGFDQPVAQLGLARLLNNESLDLPQSEYASIWLDRAKITFTRQAEEGDVTALYFLGELYASSSMPLYDEKLATEFYESALAAGYDAASERLIELNDRNFVASASSGEGVQQAVLVDKEYKQGFHFFKNISARENDWPLTAGEALELFTQAANEGHVDAQVDLGMMYQQGMGVEKDYQQAITWYRKAAEQDSAIAQYGLGEIYIMGFGVEANADTANDWFIQAFEPLQKMATQGDAQAQHRVAKMLTYGYGVERDYLAARQLLLKSQKAGNAEVKPTIEQLDLFISQVKRFVGVQTAYVRSKPEPLAPVVQTLLYGEEVLELDRDGSWVKINFSGETETKGWVYSPLITAQLDGTPIVGVYK